MLRVVPHGLNDLRAQSRDEVRHFRFGKWPSFLRVVRSTARPAPIVSQRADNLAAAHASVVVRRTANRCPTPLRRRPALRPRTRSIRSGSHRSRSNRLLARLVQKVAQSVHGLSWSSSNACLNASGTCGCEKARTTASRLLSGFVRDSGAAAVWSAANLSGNQCSAAPCDCFWRWQIAVRAKRSRRGLPASVAIFECLNPRFLSKTHAAFAVVANTLLCMCVA